MFAFSEKTPMKKISKKSLNQRSILFSL